MNVNDPIANDRALMRVIRISATLSLGLMAAFLFSIKQVTPDLKCQLSPGTGIAFVVGAVFSWVFWRVVFKTEPVDPDHPVVQARRRRGAVFVVLCVLLCLATATAFALALKGVGNEKLIEVIQGAAIALFALSGIGFLLWQSARFLDRDSKRATGDDSTGENGSKR